MNQQYGFIHPEIQPSDYIFGDAQIDAPILQADGQWDSYLPDFELQNIGFETYACASFGSLNCIETLLKRKFNFNDNYSDRYIAKLTGTDKLHGNDPQKIAEFIRKNGDVLEYEWPMLNVTTFDDYYRTPPAPLAPSALTFTNHYTFLHDYVPTDPKSLMNALRYSPVGFSVYAWQQIGDDLYAAAPDEISQNHWTMLYGYSEGLYWKVFDSYDNSHKKVEWSHRPAFAKRYHIDLAPQTVSLLQALLMALKGALASLASYISQQPPTIPPALPPIQPTNKIQSWAIAIQHAEGNGLNHPNTLNHNPFNIKYTPYTASLGALPGIKALDGGVFARFPSYTIGLKAVCQFLSDACHGELKAYWPAMTLAQFTLVFAQPPNQDYANAVAKELNVAVTTPIKNLLPIGG